jgi:hypothetical protein
MDPERRVPLPAVVTPTVRGARPSAASVTSDDSDPLPPAQPDPEGSR